MSLLSENQNLFIVDIEYKVPMDQVEPLLEGHLAFVNKGYEDGLFMASGPKVPRSGGVILIRAESREEVEGFISQDPFYQADVATFSVTEFFPRRTIDGF